MITDREIDVFAAIPQIPRDKMGFINDLLSPRVYRFEEDSGYRKEKANNCLRNGYRLQNSFDGNSVNLESVGQSLRRVFAAKTIPEEECGYAIILLKNDSFQHEEYKVEVTAQKTVITASDDDGIRRGVYFLEDRICESEGDSITEGTWRRKPFVIHRISRCFFGPTNRPPFQIDELTNDIDYYPDEYLNKLAHEGINGLWIPMYFRDFPSSIFPHFGQGSTRRVEKLRRTVKQCARYGIRIYTLFSEPKGFGDSYFSIRTSDAQKHPELITKNGRACGEGNFCTSTEAGKKYLGEALRYIFTEVPGLGGTINIILGEDNGSCISQRLLPFGRCLCPICQERNPAEVFREQAEIMNGAIRTVSPNAEFIGWFYTPGQRDGSAFAHSLADAVSEWPDDCGVMFNFESGGISEQLGKGRNVFDYSLAYIGPSELFRKVAQTNAKPAAKIQVGCSHENASVPFIPVPSNLYEKYRVMRELGVRTVMQCWFFGNYPGLMNKAAGELSFEPFPVEEDEFLAGLARPGWRKNTPTVVQAWKCFARGYRKFPANIAFAWYGPLHNSIVWPLNLFPVDKPIAPSWLLNDFPTVSGDRIGECLIYQHTLAEALILCNEMLEDWKQGTELLNRLVTEYRNDQERSRDIVLANAIELQIKSTCNVLQFYSLREQMFFYKKDNIATMQTIVLDEIANSQAMKGFCECDERLGYHSEAEGYLFYPAKLEGRIKLLKQLLNEDFVAFDLKASWIDEYTGVSPQGMVSYCRKKAGAEKYPMGRNGEMYWSSYYDEEYLHIEFNGFIGKAFKLEIEPCRLWPPIVLDVEADGTPRLYEIIFRKPPVVLYSSQHATQTVSIPHTAFEGYRREGFPMRINVKTQNYAWVDCPPWPPRLLHENYNPNATGWLLFD